MTNSERKASVIIPVFNNFKLTRDCVKSLNKLSEIVEGYEVDILVVDNGSTDQTFDYFNKTKIDNTRYIRLDENHGFAYACNFGAKSADNGILVFLNNDTVVLDGWMENLIQPLLDIEDIVVTGSKCLYPNGTIQHAGICFDNYQKPFHIYQGMKGDFPPANIQCDLKAVTGASLAVSRKNFFKYGGFSEEYINGLEDIDFCLRAGVKKTIRYVPSSVLYHYESMSLGRMDKVSDNLKIFKERWSDTIKPDALHHFIDTGFITYRSKGFDRLAFHFGDDREKILVFDPPMMRFGLRKRYRLSDRISLKRILYYNFLRPTIVLLLRSQKQTVRRILNLMRSS